MQGLYERKIRKNGLTFKLYRGEGAALLAFDLSKSEATRDFVGFTIQVRYPGAKRWGALHNRLHFDYAPNEMQPRSFKSTEAPIQKFRWIHVPTEVKGGKFRYRVSARYMSEDGTLSTGSVVENEISLAPETIAGYLNVGFTRGFASSQAYVDRFDGEAGILPTPSSPAKANLEQDMAAFKRHYEWLGFEARRLIYDVLDEVVNDEDLTLDALIYECKEPQILDRLEEIGPRLRAIIDDHGEQGKKSSCESISAKRLEAAGAEVERMHFGRQQHNKVLLVRRNGKAERVLAGSTNFSLRGLYIQANNALLFEAKPVAKLFGELFESYWTNAKSFRKSELAKKWWRVLSKPKSKVSLCFSPHSGSELSLDPVAEVIEKATGSVLYSVVFLNQIGGQVRDALDRLMERPTFSYGVAQRTSGLRVVKPDGSTGLLKFAYLASKAPQPFKREWSGNTTGHSNMVHHKFVVTDFNGKRPTVFTGSSNLSAGGEKANGDHIFRIEDRKVAIAYAIEALKLFDHFHFRVNAQAKHAAKRLRLAKPPRPGKKTWFHNYYVKGHVKERDRKLFAK